MIQLKKIKDQFDGNFDLGVLSGDTIMRITNRPIKDDGIKEFGIVYQPKTDSLWRSFKSVLVVVKYESIPLLYNIYYITNDILQDVYPDKFTAISIDYKQAAIETRLGVRAMNSLVHHPKFCFDFKIAAFGCTEEIDGYEPFYHHLEDKILDLCLGCTDCKRHCPATAIHFNYGTPPWFDYVACDRHIGSGMRDYYLRHANPPPRPFDPINWNSRGFINDRGVIYKDGEVAQMDLCQVCQRQPRCSNPRK